MAENLTQTINERLPQSAVELLHTVAKIAEGRGIAAYLVGGVVRDLLLGLPNFDLDIVVESDAIPVARELTTKTHAKLTTHDRFGTARVHLDAWAIDLATARSETYAQPGALPAVRAGKLRDDLFRRDFSINAMAVRLSQPGHGELIDLYDGRKDLQDKLVRVLHERSFIDDATRMWRAIRYEQRLGFTIEVQTMELLKRDIEYLNTISGDRIRHELELMLAEKEPEKMLLRAGELGVLNRISPHLQPDAWLEAVFKSARKMAAAHEHADLYMALLTYHLTETQVEEVISTLRPARHTTVVLRDAGQLKNSLPELSRSEIRPSHVYSVLHGYSTTAILANLIAAESEEARANIRLYLGKLRFVKQHLTGRDLQRMGVEVGPGMQEVLVLLHNARLDGGGSTREDEERLVRKWVETKATGFQDTNI